MAVTVKEVAQKAGVSFQLVAAVLGNKSYAHASKATREKILETARILGYIPNASAKILRGDSSRIIGVLIDSRAPESMYNILAETERIADAHNYRILTAQAHDNPEKLLESYRFLKQHGVDGILSLSHDYSQIGFHLDQMLTEDSKIIYILNASPENTSAVDVDFNIGMEQACMHLRENSYQKTALLFSGGQDPAQYPVSCRKRMEGFKRYFPEGEILYLTESIANLPSLEKQCRELVREVLLPGKFDSVIALTDILGVTLMNQLMKEGIRVPEDFGVVGCDNLPVGECHIVKLTTLCYDRKEIARAALESLLERIGGNTVPCRKEFPVQLQIRESTVRKK